MVRAYRNFLNGIAVTRFGKLGVALTTASFFSFLFMELARLTGAITNSYIGLITYLLFPSIFMFGLFCIPVGWIRYRRMRGKSTRELLTDQFDSESITAHVMGAKLFKTVISLSVVNILFIGVVSLRAIHFMDSSEFCGLACHEVMSPEWATYQNSPHARVACVECHVGEGADAVISAKLNGVRQMFLAATGTFNRPIPTPVHQLRPARDTCEKCHWPEKFYGMRVKSIVSHMDDEESTPLYTTLGLKVDSGDGYSGIHWHISEENEVRYATLDEERRQMAWVDVKQADGTFDRYWNESIERDSMTTVFERTLDCVDCHNRATHVYERPDRAIDDRIRANKIDRALPYIKREALAALTVQYDDKAVGLESIAAHLQNFYRENYPDVLTDQSDELAVSIESVQAIYERNIYPNMNIEWGTYSTLIGHQNMEDGCMRCHTPNLMNEEGDYISDDCMNCHALMGMEDEEPYFSE
jgi:hypothetical protein